MYQRVLTYALERMAKNDNDKYLEFWKEFGLVLKEGPAEDMANKEKSLVYFCFHQRKRILLSKPSASLLRRTYEGSWVKTRFIT